MGEFRVLITTDNHLGIYERDAFDGRCDDSFEALEEVLDGGIQRGADCVLMAGDLFEDKRPSAHTIVRTMEMFQRRCLGGDTTTDVRVLENKGRPTNLETGNVRVRLPVFAIHGNHDVPYGTVDATDRGHSVLDELHQARVLNHVGNSTFRGDTLTVDPITIQKHGIRIALYGIGWIKDVTAQRAFAEDRVRFGEPPAGAFCILLIHQNRSVYVRDRVDEQHIPSWFDLVVWGHEHECIPVPQTVEGKRFVVSQLGSTAQTKCSANEAAGKHALMLTIDQDGPPRYEPFKLERARPFVYREITVSAGEDAHARALQHALEMAETRNASGKIPMVRLRVYYDPRDTTLPAAFEAKLGSALRGHVVNPDTAVLSYRKRTSKRCGSKGQLLVAGEQQHVDDDFTIDGFIRERLREVESNIVSSSDIHNAVQGGDVFVGEKIVKATKWLDDVKARDEAWCRDAGSVAPELRRDWRTLLNTNPVDIAVSEAGLWQMRYNHLQLQNLNVDGCCDALVAKSALELAEYEAGLRRHVFNGDYYVDTAHMQQEAPKTPPIAPRQTQQKKKRKRVTFDLPAYGVDLDFLRDEEELHRFLDFDRVDEAVDDTLIRRTGNSL